MRAWTHHDTNLLNTMRDFGKGSVVPWFIAITLIAQAFIPLQSHTRLAVDEHGMVIAICTLDGMVEMTLSTEPGAPGLDDPDSAHDTDADPTPAMTFSQLMAEALLALEASQPSWLALQVSEHAPASIGSPFRRPDRLASIRAPPSLV